MIIQKMLDSLKIKINDKIRERLGEKEVMI